VKKLLCKVKGWIVNQFTGAIHFKCLFLVTCNKRNINNGRPGAYLSQTIKAYQICCLLITVTNLIDDKWSSLCLHITIK